MVDRVGAVAYVECSAKHRGGVCEVFQDGFARSSEANAWVKVLPTVCAVVTLHQGFVLVLFLLLCNQLVAFSSPPW